MKNYKKIAALFLAAMTAFSLTACGGGVAQNTVFSEADLVNKTIGVQLGTTGHIYAGDVEGASIEPYNKGFEAVQSLLTDKIDAVIIDQEPAKVFVSENEGLVILEEHFTDEEYAIAIAKDNEELVEAFNEALATLKANGKLDEIIGKYIQAE